MAEFWDASNEVEDTAKDLLGKYHPEVATANFSFVFKDKASVSEIESGIVASAKKVSPLYKLLTAGDLDFVIVISKPLWDDLSAWEKQAHLDSALSSCTVKLQEDGEFKLDAGGNPTFLLRPYDLQGHSEILARYGVDVFSEVGARIKSALKKKADADETVEDE